MVRIITLICKGDKSLRLIEKIIKNQIEEFTIDYIDILEKKDQEIIVKIG